MADKLAAPDRSTRDNWLIGGCLVLVLCLLAALAVWIGTLLVPALARAVQPAPQSALATRPPSSASTPEGIVLTGDDDSYASVRKWVGAAIARISYDGQGAFRVWNYNGYNRRLQTLALSDGPYRGVAPVDMRGEVTQYFQVQASGPWRIELLRPEAARQLPVPGNISGQGDDVIALSPGLPSVVLHIDASAATGAFILWAYGEESGPLISARPPYSDSVTVGGSPRWLAIRTSGPWSIRVEQK